MENLKLPIELDRDLLMNENVDISIDKDIKTFQNLGGFISSPIDFIGTSRKIDQNGLFSEKIFGPVKSYSCTCSAYNYRALYEGKVCPTCGVACISNESRYEIFGKIQLIFPSVKPTKLKKLLKIITSKCKNILDPILVSTLSSTKNYIGFNKIDKNIKIFNNLNENDNYIIIPLRITGIYSLYLVLRFIFEYYNLEILTPIFQDDYIIKVLHVLPPALRNVTYDATTKEYRTPEINKFYTNILQLNKANACLISNLQTDENDIIDKIKFNIENNIFDQEILEHQLIEYDIIASRYQYRVNNIYKYVYNELHGKEGLIRKTILSKNIDFSARSVVTCDPSLLPYQIRVGKNILHKLWLPYFLYYLANIAHMDESTCYEKFIVNNSNMSEFIENFDNFLDWFYDLESGTAEEKEVKKISKQCFINRQPTLWRHGCPAVDILPNDNSTIAVSPLALEAMNMD